MKKAIARLALAAAGAAGAIWLVPASVHVAGWTQNGPERIAFLPPLARLWIAFAFSAVAVGAAAAFSRRRGVPLHATAGTLAPLALLLLWLVPYLPWLADRAPVLLVLAGPLRWVIAGLAVCAVLAGPIARHTILQGSPLSRFAVFTISFLLYAALGVQYARAVGFGGDEPHYLIISHSLLKDGDLDIANNHERRDYRSFFAGELRPDFLQRGRHGEIYSIHAPGLPAALLPAYAVAGAMGAVVFMALLAAFAAVVMYDLAALAASRGVAAITWIATCFTIPVVPHAWLIYPEMAGALVVSVAVLRLWRPPESTTGALALGALLATLPWLHTKFALLLALFAAFEIVRLWPRTRQIAAFAAPIGLSAAAWLYSFYRMYGVLDPEAPYGSYTRLFVLARNIPRGTLGLLVDQKFGLLVYSPVYALAAVGAWLMLRDRRLRAYGAALLVTAIAFFISTTRLYMWWGGASAPARFLVPVVPLLAPFVAIALARLRGVGGRAAATALVLLSAGIAVVTVGSPDERLLYSDPHGLSALAAAVQGSAPLDVSLPTFTEENWRAPISLLLPWLLAAMMALATVWASICAGRLRSPFWTAMVAALTFLFLGAIGVGFRDPANRTAIVTRGRLALMQAYDPSGLHAVNVTRLQRLAPDAVLRAAALEIRRPADAPVDNPRALEGPFELPPGRYEARVWFDAARPLGGDAFVALADRVLVSRRGGPLPNPVILPFELEVGAPALVGLTDAAAAGAVRRIDVAPLFLRSQSARDPLSSRHVEPIGGAESSYIAYLDDRTYPEGGVFWTRDTRKGTVAIVTMDARSLRLILHVGPAGGPVEIEAAGTTIGVDMKPDETREISLPIPPGTRKVILSIRAAHAFRPSDVDPKSDDDRLLGCQVRPLVS